MLKQSKISDFFNIQETTSEEIISDKEKIDNNIYELFFDGGCNPNPGKGGAGAVIYKNGIEIWGDSIFVGYNETNNTSEYSGLIFGLTETINRGIKRIIVKGDSQLVIKQMRNEYKVKSDNLIKLNREAINLIKNVKVIEFLHVYRDNNKRADELANEGINRN